MKVTRDMISAAHDVTMRQYGDLILSASLLEDIYRAMRAREPKPNISWACPVCCASVERTEEPDEA